jgi:hypothetical protein
MAVMVMQRVVSRVVIGLLVLIGLVGITTRSSAQTEDPAKGAALLAEARKAVGGEDKLAAIKRLQVKGEMRRGQGNTTLDGDSEVFLEVPDKFRRNESLSIGPGGPGIDRVEILNGNEVFDENSGGAGRFGRGGGDFGGGGRRGGVGGGQPGDANQAAAQGIDPERLKELQLRNRRAEVSRLLLAFLLATDSPVAWIGTAQSPEGTADVLEVKSTNGTATRLFLESSTHLPLMMTWSGGGQRGGRGGQGGGQGRGGRGGEPQAQGEAQAAPPAPPAAPQAAPAGGQQAVAPDAAQGRRGGRGFGGGAPATLEMHLSDYKVVNGIKLPHMVTRGTNGQTAEEWTIKSYRINPTFKANTFIK